MSVLSIMQPLESEPRTRKPAPASNNDNVEPTFAETVAASFRSARDDQWGHTDEERQQAYGPIVSVLVDHGHDIREYVNPYGAQPFNYDKIWQDLSALRTRDPSAITGVPETDQAAFEQRWFRDFQNRMANDAVKIQRGGWGARLAGGMAGGLTDPINLGSMIVSGGGAGIVRAMGREALVNGLTELFEQPLVAHEREQQGRELTLGEAAANVGLATVTGAAFPVATHVGGKALGAVGDQVGGVIDRLAPGWREGRAMLSQTQGMDLPAVTDRDLLDAFDAALPNHLRTPDEKAAYDVVNREVDIDDSSPYVPSQAALGAHRERLQDAGTRLAAAGTNAMTPGRAALDSFMGKVRGAESSGDDAAANPLSSAAGRYQFTDKTWLTYYKRRFGADGQSDAAIIARKGDPAMQETLMRDLTADNLAALRKAGIPTTEGNLYLAHFAGPGGAKKLHAADPNARVEDVLGAKVVEANPFLRGKTAREVIEWADRKMGGTSGEARVVDAEADGPAARADAEPEARIDDVEMPELRRDLFHSDDAWEAAQRQVDAETLGIEVPQRPDAEIRPTVADDAVNDVLLAPVFTAQRGEPGVHIESVPGGSIDDDHLVAVFRNESGAPKGVLYFPATRGAVEFNQEGGYGLTVYVDPAYRRQGIATQLYDEAAKAAPWVNAMSGSGDLTPAGAGFSRSRRDLVRARAEQAAPGEIGTAAVSDAAPAAPGAAAAEAVPGTAPDRPLVEAAAETPPTTGRAGLPEEPQLRDAPTSRFDDPVGSEAQAQSDFLEHDLRTMADAGDLQGVHFAVNANGAEASAASVLARIDDDAAALEALRGCL